MRITKTVERWFPAEKDPDKSEFLIRHLKAAEVMDISYATSKQETKYKADVDGRLVPEMTTSMDTKAHNDAAFCAAVIDWKNVYDENGDALECTDENKMRAMREIDGLTLFIDSCRESLADDIEKDKKALEKN
ncbi:MAG: hypothetical protein GY841_12445 [FCB group bacterium]|nr:hypothetical protein [FCB group bacterium]